MDEPLKRLKKAINEGDLEDVVDTVDSLDAACKDALCREAAFYASEVCRPDTGEMLQFLIRSISTETGQNECFAYGAEQAMKRHQWEDVIFFAHQVASQDAVDKLRSVMAKSAATWHEWEVVRCLIKPISDRVIKDQSCLDSAMVAASCKEWEIFLILAEEISNKTLLDQCCLDAAQCAAKTGRWDVINQLKAISAKNTSDEQIDSEFQLCKVLEYLSNKVTDPSVKERLREMMTSCQDKRCCADAVVKELLASPYFTQAANYASMKGYGEVIKLFIQSLNHEDNWRRLCMLCVESAARFGQLDIVKLLLGNCKDTRFKHTCCMKVAEVAACCGNFQLAKYAIENIEDQEMKNQCCLKVTEASALNRQIPIMKFLVNAIADELKDRCCGNAAEPAAKNGDIEVVKYLVERIADNSVKDQCCKRAARSASASKEWTVVKYLVQSFSAEGLRDECCANAAESAAWGGFSEETKFFVASIADEHMKNQCYLKSVESAATNLKFEVAESLLQMQVPAAIKDSGCLIAAKPAAKQGYLEFIQFLVGTVSDKRVRDQCCIAAVEPAAFHGHSEVVKLLVRSADDPAAKLECCLKAAEHFGSGGHDELVDSLCDASDDAELKDQYFARAAVAAAESGKAEVMTKFLKNILDKDSLLECQRLCALAGATFGHECVVSNFEVLPVWIFRHKQFMDFLSVMALKGDNSILNKILPNFNETEFIAFIHLSIVNENIALSSKLILQVSKQLVDSPGTSEATALMLAADTGHHDLIEKLLDLGASVSAQDSEGRTALTRACEAGHVRAAKALIGRGADVCHRDGRGLTCAQLSERSGHSEVLRLLDSEMRDAAKVQDAKLSLDLYQSLCSAGFTRERATYQQAMADCLQRIATAVVRDNRQMTGSYAEGWANSLAQVNGKTAADSDIDWTVFVAIDDFHLEGGCDGIGVNCPGAEKLRVWKGHAQVPEGAGSQPAVTAAEIGIRPRQDLCHAIQCCSGFVTDAEKVALVGDPLPDVHLVNATRPGRHSLNELRVSFSLQEKRIMRNLSDTQGQLFTVIKFIFKRLLPRTMETPGLKTYHAKTLLFFMLEKHGVEDWEKAWQPENLIARLREALDTMLKFIDSSSSPDECMPHFFMPDAPLYFKNAGIGGDFDNTKSRIRVKLSELQSNIADVVDHMKGNLRVLESQSFYYHPFTLLPLEFVAKMNEVRSRHHNQYVHLGDAYCVIYQCIRDLLSGETNRNELMRNLSSLENLHWCRCSVICLSAMALLRSKEVEEAKKRLELLKKHTMQTAWTPEMFPKSKIEDWELPLDLDWAWRFCFPCDSQPQLEFLPEFTRTLLTVRLSQARSSHLYVNFRCLSWSLRAELLDKSTQEINFDSWKREMQEDPDLQELLTLAHYSESRRHLEFCLQKMEEIKTERRAAMETQDEDKISYVR